MKRKLFVLAMVVCLIVSAGLVGCKNKKGEAPEETIPTLAEQNAEMRDVSIYYKLGDDYLVPVARVLPWDTATAQAALDMLTDNAQNIADANTLGVMTTLPENMDVSVAVAGGAAKVDISGGQCPDAASEKLMVDSIASTLLGMSNIEVVQFTVGKQHVAMLQNGTAIGNPITDVDLNVETASQSVMASGANYNKLSLYYADAAGGLLVPVTRTIQSDLTLEGALVELKKGPQDSALRGVLPEACNILSAKLDGDTAMVELSAGFFADQSGPEAKLAAKAITWTCMQFDDVLDVVIQVDGQPLSEEVMGTALPTSLNSAQERFTSKQFLDVEQLPEATTVVK
ncbi:MAG: GerMN domain-containing protein [Christensenellales bacterium]|jgi:spore germination protein GerM